MVRGEGVMVRLPGTKLKVYLLEVRVPAETEMGYEPTAELDTAVVVSAALPVKGCIPASLLT